MRDFLQMHLDTGANETALYPAFWDALSKAEKSHARRKTDLLGGAGGTTKRTIESVPELRIEIGGKTMALKKLSLLREAPQGKRRYFDGVIGMDAVWSGFVLDFDAMRLEVQ